MRDTLEGLGGTGVPGTTTGIGALLPAASIRALAARLKGPSDQPIKDLD